VISIGKLLPHFVAPTRQYGQNLKYFPPSFLSFASNAGKYPVKKMSDREPKPDSTESLIESLHATRQNRSLVLNPDYLDDENCLRRKERLFSRRSLTGRSGKSRSGGLSPT